MIDTSWIVIVLLERRKWNNYSKIFPVWYSAPYLFRQSIFVARNNKIGGSGSSVSWIRIAALFTENEELGFRQSTRFSKIDLRMKWFGTRSSYSLKIVGISFMSSCKQCLVVRLSYLIDDHRNWCNLNIQTGIQKYLEFRNSAICKLKR